ncbi:cysteine--tRNA ligase [bacterium]|nr:cysteine--tRNA ligase [bacterium]
MLKLLDSYSRQLVDFEPADGKTALVYSCGPTVYDFAHIGNFRAFIFGDILCRWLRYLGFETRQVMNLTDVDDKTIAGARRAEMPLREYTDQYTQAFFDDLATLNVEPAWKYPRATEHIQQMLDLVSTLVENGHAYEVEGSVYFDISSFEGYGKLSGVSPDSEARDSAFGRLEGDQYEREEVGDFALWKAQKEPDEPAWDSPWGPGRPGWHIECSAMSMQYLGTTLDIHNGGIDLRFPHHENEIAQSEAATGKPFVRCWLHSEHLLVDGTKMSKSLGNFFTLRDLFGKGYDPMTIRYELLTAHYRKQLNFTLEGLEQSKAALDRIYTFADRLRKMSLQPGATEPVKQILESSLAEFEAAMNDDLNVPGALGATFEMIKQLNPLAEGAELGEEDRDAILAALQRMDTVLGVLKPVFETEAGDDDAEIDALVAERTEARKQRNFARADEIRRILDDRGIILEDGPEGTLWRRKH